MVETLEYLIQQAADHPRRSRAGLYRELLKSQTFLLCVDHPLQTEAEVRVTRSAANFSVWADRDPELGGVWVPVFPARDEVGDFVGSRGLRPPKGKDFLWMEHQPGEVFRLLRGVRHFAGLRLYLDPGTQVPVPWSLVRAVSEGRVPADGPELYPLPLTRLAIPKGVRIAFGRVALGGADGEGKLLCLPAAGHFSAEDIRKLVRLDLGRHGVVWMACRHFLQVLRYLRSESQEAGPEGEDILRSFMGFEMYGEAEALCEWLARKGNETFAWVCQAAILGKTGRIAECAEFSLKAAAKYPKERAFCIDGARALSSLGRPEEARKLLAEGLQANPDDPSLRELLKELDAPQAQ